jgi:TRAP-type C4-dicarboxylate transport system permease small subunit
MQSFFDSLQTYADQAFAYVKTTQGMIVVGVVALVYVLAFCRIFARTGHSAYLGFLMLVPPFALVLPLWLAFGPWPINGELRTLRKVQRTIHRADERSQRAA